MNAFVVLALLSASPPPPNEIHEIATLDRARVGTLHTRITSDAADPNLLRTTTTLDLSLRRYGTLVRLRREESTLESPTGEVLGVAMRQGSPGGKQLVLTGALQGGEMYVKVDAGRIERRLRWSADVLGLWRQHQLFRERKPKPGDRFEFFRYEPTYNAVLTVRVQVKERETVDVLGSKTSLLRVEMTPDRLGSASQSLQPPKTVWWLNDDFVPVRRQIELDGLGTIVLTRTTREKSALTPTATVDIGARSLIALDRALPRPYDSKSVLYQVTVDNEDDPGSVVCQDGHQEIRNLQNNTFELHVHPVRRDGQGKAQVAAEHLSASHFLDHADERVQQLARRAVGGETDAWKKALRIERYLKNAMSNDNSAPLVPASQIARSLRGDCRHHAFLATAMCRAEGIPARTAIGLLYVYRGGPKLGFHTWSEVLIDGNWLGIDSTLGKQGVSAAHVKITDHTWHDTSSLTPLLPVNRVAGKLRVKVLRAE